MSRTHSHLTFASVSTLLLIALTVAVFGPLFSAGFVNYDDNDYILANPMVRGGLSWAGFTSALTGFHKGNWHPLTWLSHQFDVQLFGLQPGPHHAVNVLLHTLATVLFFLLLCETTGARFRSLFAAALFGVHPLRVESVAWVAERKDLLCGVFFLVTLIAYVRWVRKGAKGSFATVAAAQALALLSKPMAVSLPLAMLLLDFWPLGRAQTGWRRVPRLVLEKLPFIALSTAAAVIAFLAQRSGGALGDDRIFPPGLRLANAAISYAWYLAHFLAPHGLSVFYRYSEHVPWTTLGVSLIILTAVTALAFGWRARFPGLPTGWLWFLFTLVPVIGLVQVGEQARADRYTYLPLIGLLVITAWGCGLAVHRWPALRVPTAAAAVALVLAAGALARTQAAIWQDSETLFRHAIRVDPDNYVALNNLGETLHRRGDAGGALEHYLRAARVRPGVPGVWANIGAGYLDLGRTPEAEQAFRTALALNPRHAEAHIGMGNAYIRQGLREKAAQAFGQAVEAAPRSAQARNALGAALAELGRIPEALARYREALELQPDYADPYFNMGIDLLAVGRRAEGLEALRRAALLGHPGAQAKLAQAGVP